MLIPGQYIETHWTNSTKNYYEGKGYVFTKNGETLLVKAEDLLPTSKIMVDILWVAKDRFSLLGVKN